MCTSVHKASLLEILEQLVLNDELVHTFRSEGYSRFEDRTVFKIPCGHVVTKLLVILYG